MEKGIKIFKELLPYIITIIVVLLVKQFVCTPIRVNGSSMATTLSDGDIMILNKISYKFSKIERFDIVVVDNPNELLIKRVIGLPGEKIEFKDNELYVNGKKIKQDFYHKETEDFKYTVSKDSYFVMGDNRTNSLDSRAFGAFKKNKILGKTHYVLFPFSRFGKRD